MAFPLFLSIRKNVKERTAEARALLFMRAVDYVLTERRSGQDFETTYAKLWLPAD